MVFRQHIGRALAQGIQLNHLLAPYGIGQNDARAVYRGMACCTCELGMCAEKKWRRLRGFNYLATISQGVQFKNGEEVKAKARASRDFLKSKIMGYPEQLVFIRCSCFDKYGRLLGEIFTDKHCKENINQLMITEGYGYKYDGGTKKK